MRSDTTAGNQPDFNLRELARVFVVLAFFLTIGWNGLAQNVTLTYTTAGTSTFTVPPGVTSITVQTWGAGGGGGGGRNANGGSGGGGGAYTSKALTVIPGEVYTITVGAGGIGGDGSNDNNGDDGAAGGFSQIELNGGSVLVKANGGSGGNQASTTTVGTGGIASADGAATKFAGGDGAVGAATGGGGGGSSAGTGADGVPGTASGVTEDTGTGGTAPTGGGSGGSGNNGTGGAGSPPGGGGAGGNDANNSLGGAGGTGKVVIAYTDNTAPTVTNVSSSSSNTTYIVNGIINITVTFSEPVIVGGNPRIQLETGTNDTYATYSGGSGTNTLTFSYTVVAGDISSDLDYLGTTAFSFNGGTIVDNANNSANLTLATPGASGSLGFNKAIVIDGVAPSVTTVSSTTGDGAYDTNADIIITVTFDEVVTVAGGTPRILLETGTIDRFANYTGGSGSTILSFTYTVQSGDASSDLDYVNTSSLQLNGATIKDASGNNAILTLASPGNAGSLGANKAIVITTSPFVTGVTSSPTTGAFKAGSPNVVITVTFNKAVTVSGTPTITLETGTTDQTIDYTSGSGTTALSFNYVIQSGDNTLDLDYVATNSLTAGTFIRDSGGKDAILTLAAPGAAGSLGANSSVIIDNIAPNTPSVPNLATSDDTGYKNNDNITKNTNVTFTGTAETGSTVRIFNNVTLIGSGTATGGNYSIAVNLTAGDYTQINATTTDAAGNASSSTSALTPTLTIDTTKPTTGQMTLNSTNPRTVSWTFSEPIREFDTNQAAVAGNFTMTGFTRTAGYRAIASQGYTESTRIGLLTSAGPSGTVWDANMKVSYAPGNIYDVAGNAMDNITDAPVTDLVPPSLATGLVLNPNDGVSKIITFNLSESLKIAEGAVSGFSSSQGTISSQTYSGKGSTETITLVGGPWDDNVTISYSNTGNVEDAGNNDLVLNPAAEPVLLKSITTFSDNAIPNTNYASTGNVVTVTFTSSRTLLALPSVTIGNLTASVSGALNGGPFTATATMTAGVTEGVIPISVTLQETGKTTTTTYTTDGSSVIFDKTPPAVTNVSFVSNNGSIGNDYFVTTGGLVTLSFTIVENFVPTVTIGGFVVNPIDLVKVGNNYTATVSPNLFPQGLVAFSIVVKDLANNTTTKTTTDNGTTVTFDTSPPTVTSITVNPSIINTYSSSINGTTPSLHGNQVDFLITFDDPVTGVSNNTVNAIRTGSVFSTNNPTITPVQNDFITPTGNPTKYWRVVYNNLSGAGLFTLEIYPFGDFNVKNIFGLPLSTGYNNISRPPGLEAPNAYTISLPEPTTPVGLISTSSISDNSITVSWGTVTGATHYLAILTTSSTAPVTDGTYVTNDTDFVDGIVAQNITQGATNSVTFNQPPSNSAYNIFIYPYALSPFTTGVNNTAIDFNTTPSRVTRSANFIRDVTFSYPTNIDYKAYTATGIDLERFSVSDGGISTFADGLPTTMSGITLNVSNYLNLNTLALFDGVTQVSPTTIVSGPSVTFTGLSFTVAEGATKTLTVKGTFKTTVTDNQVISFSVASIAAQSTGSTQFLDTTPAVSSSVTGTENKIEVVATQIDYTTVPASTSISVPLTIQVSARDANANLDADYNGSITATSNTNTGSFTTANDPTGAFTGGIKDYPVNFQFTSGNGNVQLTINSGAGSGAGNINAAAITGISPVISVISSFDSWLYFDPTFAYTPRIDFANKQEDPIVSTSQPLASLILSDGGSAAGLKNQANHQDVDGSFTKIDDFTISLTNFQDIRKIALYASDGVTKIGSDKTPAATVTFTGLSAYFAPDNGTYTFYIRASFNQTVTDLDQIAMQVTAVTHNSGSKFPEQQTVPPPTIAGVDGAGAFGDSSPLTGVNILDVIATSLDFTTQPSSYAGINEPLTVNGGNAGIVKSRDKFANLDTEFNYSFVASTPQAGINSSSLPTKFVNGVLDLGIPGMRYTSAGNGTITIDANGISSAVSSSPNKIICSQVDVIHVEGTYTGTGVLTSSNIAGGSVNKVIYGVTFDAPYKVSGGEPSLTKFIISFDNPINVLKSYRVFESRNGDSYDGNDISVTTFGGTVTANNTSRTVTVDFTTAPRDFQTVGDPVNKRLSYFLMVDVEATASGSTLPITPTVIDQGYAFPSTDSNILTSKGSATANALGKKFTFASIFPPTLTASDPAVGKLNINPNKSTIDLAFSVPVWTLDGKIKLYDKTAGSAPVTLSAINGFFDNTLAGGPDNATNKSTLTGGSLATPLSFAIPPNTLIPDHVYYVIIPGGVYNGVNQPGNAGIMDESGNLFQGISYYGTLYFKTANPAPPVLLADPSPSITDIYSNGATINTTFDQNGKAYFMVVKSIDPMPTKAQIAGIANDYTGTVIDRGFYAIDKIKPISQFGLTRSDLYTPSTTYNVWIYAENDANPTPIATKGPYGSSASNFAALDELTAPPGSPSTLSFKTTALPVGSGVLINTPTVTICKDSYQFINQPIIIYEKTTGDFSAGNVDQVFNLLLPTGYQFDVTLDGSNKPLYGTLTLSGRDAYNPTGTNNTGFVDGFGKLQFINSSTLRVTYRNNGGNTFLDDITISGLKILSTTNSGGQIERLGGNALVAAIPDGTPLAKLASSVPEGIDFSNSYSEINFPTNLTAINSIPDNFNEPSLLVTLIPEPPVGDYGADIFSGQGVNVDQLSLASVTINSPFNITLTHTDNNGCISQNSLQYTVYDHTTAIRDLSIKYGIYNPNFISSTFKSAAPTGIQKDTVFYNNLPAYFMYTVKADTLRGAKQFISGKAWADVLSTLPKVISTTPDPDNTGGPDDRFYNTYELDWATILNAEFNTGDPALNPYLNLGFRQTTNTNYNYEFFTGGSLGIVEFNADYQSIANASVQLPLKQNVEFFLNPIPVVEVYNPSDIDVNDTNNLPFATSNSGPSSNLGTLIFCEGGGKISISGFPKATSGTSKGFFVLTDVVSGDTIYYDHPTNSAKDKLPNGFKDFGSGDAELTPNLIINGYEDIKVSYTYQDDNSPIAGSSYQIIRVTPNPKASFSASSIVASNNVANVKLRTLPDGRPSTFLSYCEDNLISFNNTAQFLDINNLPIAGYTAKRNPVWVMGDPLNSRNRRDTITDNGVLTLADSVLFKYSDIGTYQAEFSVESQYGCRSNVYTSSITIGEIPTPGFDITGLSTATPIVVTNTTKSSIPPNSSIATNSEWNFGDPYEPDLNLMVFIAGNTNTYPTPGHYTVTLKATTTAGCEISYQRPVIIVPAVTLNATQPQITDDFESTIQLNQWQTSSTDTLKASWVKGVSQKDSLRLKTNVWITKIKDDYNPNEESYLYSPVYDLNSLARPMISFDQAANLAKNDGVTLEFSVDNLNFTDLNKKWIRLGVKGEGTNWYDEAGLASKPGDQPSGDYGWSRKDSSSRSSRHALSPDLPSKNQVAFRFAFSSVSATGDQGFAIDNFRIGERTRTVLIENFTNKGTSNSDEKTESDYLKNDFSTSVGGLNGLDFIKINYHVGFPGVDPFNTTNPADPSARALYYNVSKTPTAFLDSYDDPFPLNSVNRLFSKWGATVYGTQSLELAGADITITATLLPSNTYSVSVSVTAKKDLPASTILHTGFLEAKIISTSPLIKTGETEFEYVLKKLLPSAAGTRFGTPLLKDQTKTFGPFEWTADPAKLFPDTKDDLAVVAFLQDESTKEVHQSALKSGLTDPAVVTGIEAILPEQVNVFPNPASSEFRVELPAIVQNEARLHLIDMAGRKYEKGMIPSGGNSATVNVEDLSEGVYILEIGTGSTGIVRKKIMVVMKNQ